MGPEGRRFKSGRPDCHPRSRVACALLRCDPGGLLDRTFDRFTAEALETVELTSEEAGALGHGYVGVEHILLGLLRQEQSVARRALDSLGLSLDFARERLARIVPAQEPAAAPTGEEPPPFTPRALRVLEFALGDAIKLGSQFVGPEHILLAIAREGQSLATLILREVGAESVRVQEAVRGLLPLPPVGARELPPVATLASASIRVDASAPVTRLLAEAARHALDSSRWAIELPDLIHALERDKASSAVLAQAGMAAKPKRERRPRGPTTGALENFTPAAREVVVVAQAQARVMRHRHIGTEHLLLGLIADRDSVAGRALASLAVTGSRVQARLLLIVGPGDGPSSGALPITPGAAHVLEVAGGLTATQVGPEHILIALLQEGGVALRILDELDASAEHVARRVQELLGYFPRAPGRLWREGPERSVAVGPAPDVRRLLMRAAARALQDGRLEIRVGDLLRALAGDLRAGAWLAATQGVDVEALRGVIEASVRPTGRIRLPGADSRTGPE